MTTAIDNIIDTLGGTNEVARALGLAPPTVSSWRERRSIPSTRWLDLARLAHEQSHKNITLTYLAVLHSKPIETIEQANGRTHDRQPG